MSLKSFFTQLKTMTKLHAKTTTKTKRGNPHKLWDKLPKMRKILGKNLLPSSEYFPNKKWVDPKCPGNAMTKFIDIKCDAFGHYDKIVFMRKIPTPFIY